MPAPSSPASIPKSRRDKALDKLVHRKRCEKPDSLDLLGKAAFAEESSPEEFRLYEQILRQDPNFSEVVLWNAGERYAGTAETSRYLQALAVGVELAPQPQALYDLHESGGTGAAPWTQIRRWVDRLEALTGADHPAVAACRVRQTILDAAPGTHPRLPREEMSRFVKIAAKHPNHHGLLRTLIGVQAHQEPYDTLMAPVDAELLGSLCITSMTNRSLPPRGHAADWFRLAQAARDLDRPQQVFEALRRRGEEPDAAATYYAELWQGDALMDTGNFSWAIDHYWKAGRLARYKHHRHAAVEKASVCAIYLNQRSTIEDFAVDPDLQADKLPDFFKACLDYLDGKVAAEPPLRDTGDHVGELLLAERELAQGGDFSLKTRSTCWSRWVTDASLPESRLRWILLERFYAVQPDLQHSEGLYETIDWLMPDDPYFKPLVAAWRAAHPNPKLPSVDDVLKNLEIRSWTRLQRYPDWTVMARIRRDLDEARPDDAKRVLQAYMKGRSHDSSESSSVRNS